MNDERMYGMVCMVCMHDVAKCIHVNRVHTYVNIFNRNVNLKPHIRGRYTNIFFTILFIHTFASQTQTVKR